MMTRFSILLSFGFLTIIVLFLSIENVLKKNEVYFVAESHNKINDNLIKSSKKYVLNKEFLINNNLAQYSSYLIVDQDELTKKTIYRIEAIVHFNYKYIKDFGGKENFTFVLKLLGHGNRQEDIVIELEATDSPKLYWNDNKKLIYNFDLDLLKKNSTDEIGTILKNIVVAIIWKNDFNKNLDMNSFTILNDASSVLPYNLIKFQIPSIIESIIPRLKTVGFCISYTYSIPVSLRHWTNLHLSFGIRELMMYDAVSTNLSKYIKTVFGDDKRITVNPFNIELNDLCNDMVLFQQFEEMNLTNHVKEYLIKSCTYMYNEEFHQKINLRQQFEQLTSNDCFTVMKEKYEFIGYYDLDEFVYPRTIENVKDFNSNNTPYYSCSSFDTICSHKPFQIRKNENENYFYNYLQLIIEKVRNGRNISQLGSISFAHAIYLIPDHHEKKLIYDLGSVIENIEQNNSNSSAFPFKIFLSSPPFKEGHTFLIQKEDVDYIKYLYKSYNSLIPCAYRSYLKNISSLEGNLVRYLYYLTEGNERIGKSIHYYKNIKSLFVHYAQDYAADQWTFDAPEIEGYMLSHYRIDASEIYSRSFEGSIRKLNIDLEYLFNLLKNYTSFCEI